MPEAMQGFQFNTPALSVKGPDVQHGLGWVVLLAAIAASGLPYFVPEMNFKKQHLVAGLGLGLGLLVMFSLLTQNLRFASFGILLCLAGYAISILGAIQEWKAAR
jgi:tryptophan-rich sensory protein